MLVLLFTFLNTFIGHGGKNSSDLYMIIHFTNCELMYM